MIQLDKNGIPITNTSKRPKEIMVYRLWKEERSKIDHTKFPWSKAILSSNKVYETWDKANRAAKRFEKSDPNYIYYVRSCFLTKKEINESK